MSSNLSKPTIVEFTKQKAAVSSRTDLALIDLKYEELKDVIEDQLIHRLSAFVLRGPVAFVDTESPKNVWQHFKHTYFPYWAKQVWPVEYIKTRIEVSELFPEATNEHLKLAGSRSGARHIQVRIQPKLKISGLI